MKEFFDKFVTDFVTFDGNLIASRYLAPYIAVSTEGVLHLYQTPQDIAHYFQGVLDDYRQQGVGACAYSNLETSPVGGDVSLSTVTWRMLGHSGEVISRWRESYTMLLTVSGLKIFTSVDHPPIIGSLLQ